MFPAKTLHVHAFPLFHVFHTSSYLIIVRLNSRVIFCKEGVKYMKLPILQFSSVSFSFLPLRLKHIPENPSVKHTPPTSVVKPTRCTSVSNLFYFGLTLYMFRTVFPSIIRCSRLYIKQQAFFKEILMSTC